MLPWPGEPVGPPRTGQLPWSGQPWSDQLRGALLRRRIVLLRGDLDDEMAGRVVAELLLLAGGDEAATPDGPAAPGGPVTLHVDSAGGPLRAAFAVIDTIDTLPVPVEAVCIGRAEGSASAVVAAAPRRRAARHARLRLHEPSTSVEGGAADLAAWSARHAVELVRLVERLAEATGRPAEHLEADVEAGRWFTAEEAVAYRLVDGLWAPGR